MRHTNTRGGFGRVFGALFSAFLAFFFVGSLLGVLAPSVAGSTTFHAAWTNPTTRTDGSAFDPATEQASVTVSWGTTPNGPYPNQTVSPGAATAVDVPFPGTPGKYYVVATVTANDGTVSAPTPEVLKAVAANPSPPSNLTAN